MTTPDDLLMNQLRRPTLPDLFEAHLAAAGASVGGGAMNDVDLGVD